MDLSLFVISSVLSDSSFESDVLDEVDDFDDGSDGDSAVDSDVELPMCTMEC